MNRVTAKGVAPVDVIRRHTDQVKRVAADKAELVEALAVLFYLCRVMNGGCRFTVNPSRAAIAEHCHRSERQVTRLIQLLEAGGFLDVDRDDPVYSRGKGWHRRRCNRYRLVIPPEARKARSRPGDMGGTRSNAVPTDRTGSVPCTPVDNPGCTPPDPPWPGPTPGGLAIIARLKAERGIA